METPAQRVERLKAELKQAEREASGLPETLGERLQRLRKSSGLTQPAAATAAAVPVATLRNWESDRREPLLSAAARLAKALGVSLDELAGLTPSVVSGAAPASEATKGKTDETAQPRQVE